MKRFTLFGGALLLLGFVMTGCDTSDAVGPEGLTETGTQAEARPTYDGAGTCDAGTDFDYCVDLVAGQTQKVGQVYYAYDAPNFTISYQITTPGLCLDVVHYGVYDDTDDVPVVGRGNIPPGQLTYQSPGGCETSFTEHVEITGLNDNTYYVLAHAGVVDDPTYNGGDASCPVIAGIGHGADGVTLGGPLLRQPQLWLLSVRIRDRLRGSRAHTGSAIPTGVLLPQRSGVRRLCGYLLLRGRRAELLLVHTRPQARRARLGMASLTSLMPGRRSETDCTTTCTRVRPLDSAMTTSSP